jgi:type I restriction enzyme S subunit
MKAYPEYKPSGIESLGDIPAHWKMNKLNRICYMKGRIGWQGLKQFEFTSEGPYLITGMNFKDGIIRWDEVYHITEERYNEAPEIQLKVGDVLMTKDGTIGKLLYVDHLPDKASLNSHLLVLRPLENNFNPKYLYYLLHSSYFKDHIELYKTGTTFFGLTQEGTGKFKMLLPSLEEQDEIIEFLDRYSQNINDLIDKKTTIIELLKKERAAVIYHVVTKGLKIETPTKESGIEWLGKIPKHWEIIKLKYLADSLETGITPPSDKKEYFENGDIDWFTPADFRDDLILSNSKRKITKLAIDHNVAKIYNPNTVLLISIGATLGKVGITESESSSNQQINAITLKNNYNPVFVAHYLRSISDAVVSLSNSATLAILNLSQTKEIPVLVPPTQTEQAEIVKFIETSTAKIDFTISRIEKEIELLHEYSTVLLSEVVTGKIDTRNEVAS